MDSSYDSSNRLLLLLGFWRIKEAVVERSRHRDFNPVITSSNLVSLTKENR